MKYVLAFLLLTAVSHAGHCVAVLTDAGLRGSAAVIYYNADKDYYGAVTAKHVLEGVAAKNQVQVSADDKWHRSFNFWTLDTQDIAFIEFRANGVKLTPFEFAEADAVKGDTVEFQGFAYGNDWIEGTQTATVTAPGFANGANYPPYKGQSGGCVLNDKGEIVGVVHGTSPNQLIYAPLTKIQKACDGQFGLWFGAGRMYRCPPGGCAPRRVVPPPYAPPPYASPPPYIEPPVPPQSKKPPTPSIKPDLPPPPPPTDKPWQRPDEKPPLPTAPVPAVPSNQAAVDALKSELKTLRIEFDKLKYTQIPVRIETPDGKLFDSVKVRLDKSVPKDDPKLVDGQPIILRLTPKPKAN